MVVALTQTKNSTIGKESMSKLVESFFNEYLSVGGSFDKVDSLNECDSAIVFGSRIADDSKEIASLLNSKELIYMHPISDDRLDAKYIKYEAGSEEGVALLLLNYLLDSANLPSSLKAVVEDLDIGYLSGETSISEEELEELSNRLKGKKVALIVGLDIFTHESSLNIANIVATISKYSTLKVISTISYNNANLEPKEIDIVEPEELPSYDGVVVYNIESNSSELLGSKQFAMAAKLRDGAKVEFEIDGIKCNRSFKIDDSLKGTIALNPISGVDRFYRFNKVNIKIGSENG